MGDSYEVIEVVFKDEHGEMQMLRTTPLAGARLAGAIVDALRDAGYIDDDDRRWPVSASKPHASCAS